VLHFSVPSEEVEEARVQAEARAAEAKEQVRVLEAELKRLRGV